MDDRTSGLGGGRKAPYPAAMMKVTADMARIVGCLKAGGVIAYPTESVWGLGCDPANSRAVDRLLGLKGRAVGKGLILIAADVGQLRALIAEDAELQRARADWPGPITWVLSASQQAPDTICRDDGSIAVRVTAHPLAAALCRGFGGPLVSTSANPAGQSPATNSDQVTDYFGNRLDLLVSGETGGRPRPSVIRDARTGATLRAE